MKKREIVLKPEETKAILQKAKEHSQRDHLIFSLMAIDAFRVGELVGSDPRRRGPDGKWEACEPNCEGLKIEDLRENTVWVRGKGVKTGKSRERLQPIPPGLMLDLRQFIGTRKQGKIFDLSINRVEQLARQYAKEAGVQDWQRVHPHRFRHFAVRQIYKQKKDVVLARDIAGHSNISTTNRYIAESDPEDKKQAAQQLEDLLIGSSV